MRVLLISSGDADSEVVNTLKHAAFEVINADARASLGAVVTIDVYDLMIVDMERTRTEPVATLARLRNRAPTATILMLSSGPDTDERIAGLNAGADDCLSRPFDPIELRARVRALSRRGRTEMLRLGGLVWDLGHHQGTVDSVLLSLSRYETALLEALLKSPNHVVPLDALAQHIETVGGPQANNRLYVYISRLRKKLAGSRLRIRSASSLGYSIESEVDAS